MGSVRGMSPTRHKEDEEVWKADGVRRHKTNASYKEQKKAALHTEHE